MGVGVLGGGRTGVGGGFVVHPMGGGRQGYGHT